MARTRRTEESVSERTVVPVELKLTGPDYAGAPGSRLFQCPGCGAPHVAIPTAGAAPAAGTPMQFHFTCLNTACAFGPAHTPYDAELALA
jgi:hypothetical protein